PKYLSSLKTRPSALRTPSRESLLSAGGIIRSYIAAALLKTRKYIITALSRKDSSNKLPKGVLIALVDYNNKATIIAALKD
ncbi:hypothetical protein N7527_006591, partial [Penicillium freii]